MRVTDFLDESGVSYEVTEHRPAFTAQQIAAEEHEPGKYVAKPVIIRADGQLMMCVLPAPNKADMGALKSQLGVQDVELVEEKEIADMFPDCELGAEPPFGNLYDMPTILDKTMQDDDHILFQAGTHEQGIRLSMKDYIYLVKPHVLDFSYHVVA